MPKALFSAEEFTPTQWSTAQDKATFGNHFFRFIESGWKQTLFTRGFYNRLSNCFGHIAHYDLHGFYGHGSPRTRFASAFCGIPCASACYGDPGYTFSDVERAIKAELRRRPLVDQYEARVAAAVRSRELAQLERLQAKYGTAPASPVVPQPVELSYVPLGQPQPPATQISLF